MIANGIVKQSRHLSRENVQIVRRMVIKYGVVLSCESKFVVVCSLCGSARPKRGYVLHYVSYYKRGSYPLVIVQMQDIIYSFDLLS